ncbi:glycosyltransferase family 4 protein [Aurantivibrio plasticivorans]
MAKVIMQLLKQYRENAPLINSMVKPANDEFQTVCCYLSGESDGENDMEARAKKTIYCGLNKRRLVWTNWRTVKTVAEAIDQQQVDLLVCQFRRTIPIGVAAALLSKRKPKVIGVLHGIVGGANSFSRKLVNYFAYKPLTKMVAVSDSGAEEIIKHNFSVRSEHIAVIENGVDTTQFQSKAIGSPENKQFIDGCADDDFIFMMVGRLAPVKNHVRALHAFRKIVSEHPQAKLVIVGRGSVEAQLQLLIDEMELTKQVRLLGFRSDVPELLKRCDVFLMPSVRESFGMALSEAMLSGVPAITSEGTGTQVLVPDNRYGYLVDPNSIESIYGAMKETINADEGVLQEKARLGRERILENFTSEKMADKYEQLYRDVLA